MESLLLVRSVQASAPRRVKGSRVFTLDAMGLELQVALSVEARATANGLGAHICR
jgi:hypothetical protein